MDSLQGHRDYRTIGGYRSIHMGECHDTSQGNEKPDKKVITADCSMVPIPKSIAGGSLLTDLIIGKYVDHLPFWRQIAQYKRFGYEIKQPTLESWFHEVVNLMRPLYYGIHAIMLYMAYLQSDESTVPGINNEKHRAVKGYIWLIRSIMV